MQLTSGVHPVLVIGRTPLARYEIEPAASQVWIDGSSSVHPIHATANGLEGFVELGIRGAKLQASPPVSGEVRIQVDALRSGNRLVDRETRRRVDSRRHPDIVGEVLDATVVGRDRLDIRGSITFRGQTCEVEGTVTVDREGDHLLIEGEQTLDVRDWGLEPPRVAMLKVAPEILVRVSIRAARV